MRRDTGTEKLWVDIETGVTKVEGKRGTEELEVERKPGDLAHWTFVKPKYGPAGAESEAEEPVKKKNPFEKEPPPADPLEAN